LAQERDRVPFDLQSFAEGNGEGVGDFPGLSGKLDYLAGLNVNCLWFQPFFPSPGQDHGYDTSDYYGVDPRYGSLSDFVEFRQAARDRGISVIADCSGSTGNGGGVLPVR